MENTQQALGRRAARFFAALGLGREQARHAGKGAAFLAFFALFYAALMGASLAVPDAWEAWPVARLAQAFLAAQGIDAALVEGDPLALQVQDGPLLLFSYLCAGVFEFVVLASAILASAGIGWRARLVGVAAGALATAAFNAVRVLATLQAILAAPPAVADLVHGTLFRVTLLAVIVGVYGAWFWWATRAHARAKPAP